MRSWTMKRPRSWALLFAFLPVLAGCASLKGHSLETQGDQAFELAHYTQALDFYKEVQKLRPGDEDLARKIEITRTALFYTLGRDAFYQGKLAKAEWWFRKILASHPDQELARQWLDRVRKKQALEWVDRAEELASRGHPDQAMALLERSLEILPGEAKALALSARLAKQRKALLDKGRDLVRAGLRVLRESLGEEGEDLALYHMMGAKKVMGSKFQYPWILKELERRFLERARKEIRAALEEDQYALVLFMSRYAQVLFPGRSELKRYEQEAKAELRAQMLAGDAQAMLFRGNPDKAEALFREAARVSKRRSGIYLAGLEDVREARLALAFEAAEQKEYEGLYEEALARLKKLALQAPDYRDVESRVEDLEASLKEGRKLLARAEELASRGKKEEALQTLKELFSLLPFYKDGLILKDRILSQGEGE